MCDCICNVRNIDLSVLYSLRKNSTSLQIHTFAFSTFGMALSITALVFLLLTAMLFTEWRRNYKNQLLIQFMVARFFYTLVRYINDVCKLLHIVDAYFNPFYLDAIPMAYTEMALITWMFIFTKQMRDNFLKVISSPSPSLLKISLAAWLAPATVSTVLFAICKIIFHRDLKFFILYLFLLKWPLLCANGIFLVLVLKYILSTNKSKTECNPRFVIVMIILIFTFCFQQAIEDIYKMVYVVFKLEDKDVYTPLFFVFINILSVYHCAFSIIFWLFANKRTRVLWGFSKEYSNTQNEANIPKFVGKSCSIISNNIQNSCNSQSLNT